MTTATKTRQTDLYYVVEHGKEWGPFDDDEINEILATARHRPQIRRAP